MLKDKLRHIKFFKSLLESGSTKPKVVRSTPPKGRWEEDLYVGCIRYTRKLFEWLELKWLPYLEKPSRSCVICS